MLRTTHNIQPITPVRRLLKDCKWLSVNQLIFYQTVLQTHKVLVSGKPVFLKQKMNTLHPYRTRQAAGGGIWRGGGEGISEKSFITRGSRAYNTIPSFIRQSTSIQIFKKKLCSWISNNIPIS